jgi:hypothetical protein
MVVRKSVEKKLAHSILPRLEGAKRVRRHFRHIVYVLHRYLAEGALVILGLGFSHPVIVAMSGGKLHNATDLSSAFANFNPYFLIGATLLGICWIVMRTYVSVEKLAEKGPLTMVAIRELETCRADLEDILATSTPLKALGELQDRICQSIYRAHQAGAWPWAHGPKSEVLSEKHAKEARQLCDTFESDWAQGINNQVDQEEPK